MHSCQPVADGRLTGSCILRFEREIPERLVDLGCSPILIFYNIETHQVGFFRNDELIDLNEAWIYCAKAVTPFNKLENSVDISFALRKFSEELCFSDGDCTFFIDAKSNSGLVISLTQ